MINSSDGIFEDSKISEEAKDFIKKNKVLLIEKFANKKDFSPKKYPISIFMAGSPGAGKTEYSKRLIEKLGDDIVRIDADEIREIIPHYTGENSDIVQGAASIGVDILYNYTKKKKFNILLDGTFSKYDIARRNIQNSLDKNRVVVLCYVYQNPKIAYDFVKKREIIEGRRVPRDIFINAFLDARKNVVKIKNEFKNKIKVYLIIKDYTNNTRESYFDIDIDNYLKSNYNIENLKRILK